MLLNSEWVKNEIREEIKNFLETNENELTTIQTLWDRANAVLRGKFEAIQAYLKRIETFQKNKHTSIRIGGTTANKSQGEQKEGNNQDQSRIK